MKTLLGVDSIAHPSEGGADTSGANSLRDFQHAATRGSAMMLRRILTTALCLMPFGQLHAEIRWQATFQEKYRSAAEGAEVAFSVRTPPAVDGVEAYPLVVVLNGGLGVPPSAKFPHFQAQPSRNGIWGYRTISTYDALQVIAFMKRSTNHPARLRSALAGAFLLDSDSGVR